jgi:hypothetical protein
LQLVCRGVLFSTASERVNWTSKHSRPRQGIVRNEDVRGTHEFCRIECDREARRVNDRLGDITFECLFVKIRRLYEKTRVVVMYPKRTITNTTRSREALWDGGEFPKPIQELMVVVGDKGIGTDSATHFVDDTGYQDVAFENWAVDHEPEAGRIGDEEEKII